MKPQISAKDLSAFFWKHLENDITMLSQAISKNEDEACLLLHAVLERISSEQYPNGIN